MTTIKWVDLSRFGARLRVLPNSPLRGTRLTCLDVYKQDVFTANWKTDGTQEGRVAVQEAWRSTCERLGFGTKPVTHYEDLPGGGQQQVVRFVSSRMAFTLTDLQALVPGVEIGDLKETDVEDIALRAMPNPGMPQAWEQFARDVLSKEAIGVWTPKISPFDRAWDAADSFESHRKELQADERLHRMITRRGLGGSSHMRYLLDQANYRTNALVPFYVDEETALADGWRPHELEQVDLPYAVPLWVTRQGQIQALRDIRYMPELLDADPESYLGPLKNGVVIGALREIKAIEKVVRAEMAQWAAWAENPSALDMPDLLWGSFTEIASAHAELSNKYPTVISSGMEEISDGKEAERRGAFRAKPLAEMDADTMFWMSRLCARYASLQHDEAAELKGVLDKVLVRGHELMAEHVQALATRELEEISRAIKQAADVDDASAADQSKVRHEDAGEKIGGARKDFAKRAMVADDLEVMNDAERDLYVVKKNVWGPLDYAAMRADGVEAEAALGIKVVKDKLLSAPTRLRDSDGVEIDALYIQAVGMVRDRMAGVKTLADFNKACHELCIIGNRDEKGQPTNTIFGRPLQRQWGTVVSNIFWSDGRTPAVVYREIRRKIEIWNRDPTEDEKWRFMIKAKVEKTDERLAEERAKSEMDRELHRPHLDRVERSGEDWRGGRDMVADDLLEHFGFRAVEFGNWLPQDERQQVLNLAFDSFCDLAAALKIPPKGVSFDGKLAVAFGSRGRGGKGAALAHFEPARMVINLTRMNGAGFLAHEWWHSLDRHLGGEHGYRSEIDQARGGTVMSNLCGRMYKRLASGEEILEQSEANSRKGLKYTLSWLQGQPQEVRDKLFDVLHSEYDQAEAELYGAAQTHIETVRSNPNYAQQGFGDTGAMSYSMVLDLAERVLEVIRSHCTSKPAFTKAKKNFDGNLHYMMSNLAKVATVKAAKDLGVVLPERFRGHSNCQPSQYKQEAEKLDKTRSSAYWATTVELFARAGAAYVIDKITDAGGRSDYLVYGADEGRYAEHPVGNPNPTGEDRRDLANHFDALIAEYRLDCLKNVEQEVMAEP